MSFLNATFRGLILSFLACPMAVLAQTNSSATNTVPAAPPIPEGIAVEHDGIIGKGGDHDLHAEIAYPKDSTKPLPAVIYIHGGGWIGGSHKNGPIIQLAKAGYFAASVEYRLSNVAKWPAQIQDCKLGVRWLRANAAKYNIDPNRIGVWGASAGGHLVTCLGTMADIKEYEGDGGYPGVSSAVQVVVDFYGPTDFITPNIYTKQALDLTTGLFGVPREQNLDLWKSGSPIFYVKAGDPPMFLVHGDADSLVPLAQSTTFGDALNKAGVPYEILVVKNGEHSFKPKPGTIIDPSRADIDRAVLAFLDKHLKTP